ncbi:hypothetical protein B0H19DRAFT_1271246 [Mycena capillaripes]|nr:hypothetical protein B0H19DRAFT_1271246 [Mycena capillaripes]
MLSLDPPTTHRGVHPSVPPRTPSQGWRFHRITVPPNTRVKRIFMHRPFAVPHRMTTRPFISPSEAALWKPSAAVGIRSSPSSIPSAAMRFAVMHALRPEIREDTTLFHPAMSLLDEMSPNSPAGGRLSYFSAQSKSLRLGFPLLHLVPALRSIQHLSDVHGCGLHSSGRRLLAPAHLL